MVYHEDHEVNIYYYEGEEHLAKEWEEGWKKEGYVMSFEARPTNGEQGNITMKKRVIPKEWLTSIQD